MTKRILAIAAALSGLARWMPAQPTIADNFTSSMTVESGTASTSFNLYESYAGQQAVLHSTDPTTGGSNSAYQFWSGQASCSTGSPISAPPGGGLGYLYESESPFTSAASCSARALFAPAPASGFWDFLKNAKQEGTCSSNGRTGTLWADTNTGLVLCANGNTPISLAGLAAASTQPIIGNLAAAGPTMVTNTFIAAVPAPSNFCLPALCSTPSVRVGLPNGCDGFYWGSIAGGLTVSEGQNCLIFGGTVNGSILQIGGNLVVVGSTIKGDVTVLGGGTFSLGAATKIQGSLNVGLLPASSTTNQVCNVNVSGSVTYQLSAAPVDIGSSAACGNTVGGSLYVNATTAPVEADGNTVAGNLECLGNLSITGSGNAAKRKQGQCAGF